MSVMTFRIGVCSRRVFLVTLVGLLASSPGCDGTGEQGTDQAVLLSRAALDRLELTPFKFTDTEQMHFAGIDGNPASFVLSTYGSFDHPEYSGKMIAATCHVARVTGRVIQEGNEGQARLQVIDEVARQIHSQQALFRAEPARTYFSPTEIPGMTLSLLVHPTGGLTIIAVTDPADKAVDLYVSGAFVAGYAGTK